MDRDVHLYIEMVSPKVETPRGFIPESVEYFAHFEIGRPEQVFKLLLAQPRGIPEVMSFDVKHAYYQFEKGVGWLPDPDWHSTGWLTLAETVEVYTATQYLPLFAVVSAMQVMASGEAWPRLTYWFDN